ncbi:MAG: ATP-binding protein [Armatimonadetes bacterium]|nr:ATP-binding protein [Armatimonadota bacterium]
MDNISPPVAEAARGRIELKIPASAQWVRVARLTVAGVASRLHFGIGDVEDIKLAVAEAINNAILHAPVAPDGEAMVSIVIESDSDGLWIIVTDEGRVQGGLSVEDSAPDFDGELPEGGLGLLLIRSLMDEVSHESGSHADTVVKMFKRLPARAARGA